MKKNLARKQLEEKVKAQLKKSLEEADPGDGRVYPRRTGPGPSDPNRPPSAKRKSRAGEFLNPDPLGLEEQKTSPPGLALPPRELTPGMRAIYERAVQGDKKLRFLFERAFTGNRKAQYIINALAENRMQDQILSEQETTSELPTPEVDEGLSIDALIEELEEVEEGQKIQMGMAHLADLATPFSKVDYSDRLKTDQRAQAQQASETESELNNKVNRRGRFADIDANSQETEDAARNESQDPLKRMRDLALKSYGSYKYED